MRKTRLALNYEKLKSRERFSLVAQAMLRADGLETDLLKVSAPDVGVCVPHHHFVVDIYIDIADYYLVGQLNRAVRLLFYYLTSLERDQPLPSARLIAYAFLQHQAGWLQFSKTIGVPPSFAFLGLPGTDATLRSAEHFARVLGSSGRPAEAPLTKDPLAQPTPADELSAEWQKEFDSVKLPVPEPDGPSIYPIVFADNVLTTPEPDPVDEPVEQPTVAGL